MEKLRLQSAMEYLMTYSWAILIIAVVLGTLFGLGFFNSAALAPKTSAGSCQVYRPDGPGTTTFINTEGTCNNELPQYVAQFNGQSSVITLSSTNPNSWFNTGSFVLSAWVRVGSTSVPGQYASAAQVYDTNVQRVNLRILPGSASWRVITASGYSIADAYNSPAIGPNQFADVVWEISNGVTFSIYVNGALIGSANHGPSRSLAFVTAPLFGGEDQADVVWFNGSISNVQIYNASLSANEITALYDEGIGGVPLNLNSLVGWWPLNGNANDYSGNLNNGFPSHIVYTSSWTVGYTAP